MSRSRLIVHPGSGTDSIGSMVTKPVPSQARSRSRREALLRAAIGVLAEGGSKAVTHRAVAARAGVPLASTTYYFKSIDELTEEALRLHVTERVAELEALTAEAAEGGRTVEEIALRFADALVGRSREAMVAQFEVYLEASRVPTLREPVARALLAFEELAARALAALGARRPEEAALAFVAILDGFALHRLARPLDPERDAALLFDAMASLFVAYAMDEDEFEMWRARFRRPLAG